MEIPTHVTCLIVLLLYGLLLLFCWTSTNSQLDIYKPKEKLGKSAVHSSLSAGEPIVSSSKNKSSPRVWGKVHHGTKYKVLFNVVPKTGSRSISIAVSHLLHRSAFKIVPNARNESAVRDFLNSNKSPFFRGHIPYLNLSSDFLSFSLVRDPVERFVSLYYYSYYGDNLAKKLISNNTHVPSIDECVLQKMNRCSEQRVSTSMMRFFCGSRHACWNATTETFDTAVANLDMFVFVGLTEDLTSTIKVMEKLLPDMVDGLTKSFAISNKKTQSTTKTVFKDSPRPETKRKLRASMELEYKLYYIIKKRFEKLKKI